MKSILGTRGRSCRDPIDVIKQGIIDYHIQKMLKEGKIQPIQSPYACPVVLTSKNDVLPPDSPKAYRFTFDYRSHPASMVAMSLGL
ncbi:hypothetical protein TNCV_1774241 [Trichonephila clavipes]|nr:hypothetical protein TNCV_1774241 [Trichonephila clavipes]